MTVTTLAYIPSPAQGVWYLGPVPLRAYALCIIAGIIAALVIGDRRWEARGGERGVIYDIALWAVPFGLVGGRLYHVLTDWPTYFGAGGAGLGAAFRIWDGGLGIWGAVALGAVGAWIACRRRGIPLPAFGDAIAPGIILAQAIGRLGNYFNQELYGRATDLPWGLEIYERVDASGFRDTLNGVSTGELVAVVHPTFLYELLWNLLVFGLLIWADRRFKLGHGRVFALYVAGYCLGRFWIELMRSDTATLIAGIRVNSFTATFVFIAAVVYIMAAPKGREDPASLRGNAAEPDAVEEPATEVIAVGAMTGVVAATQAAGAAEDEGTASAQEPDIAVAEAADEADEVEEGVTTEALVTEADEAEDEAGSAEAELADELDAEEQAAQDEVVQDEAVDEVGTEDDSAIEEPADEVTEAPEAEDETGSAEAELADELDAEEQAAQDEAGAEDEAAEAVEPAEETAAEEHSEAEAEEAEAEAEPTIEAEPATEQEASDSEPEAETAEADDQPVAEQAAAEEAEAEAEPTIEAEPATEQEASDSNAEAETAEADDQPVAEQAAAEEAEAEADEEPTIEAEPATEQEAGDSDAEAETAEADDQPDDEVPAVVEEPAVEKSGKDSASVDEAEAPTAEAESAAAEPTAAAPAPAGGKASRLLRKLRRKG